MQAVTARSTRHHHRAMDEQYAALRPTLEKLVRGAQSKFGFCLDEGEVRSAAHLGFVEAVRRYDEARGIPFEAFARHRILGSIMDELRGRDRLSRPGRQRAKAVEKQRQKLVKRLAREPTSEELARASGEELETFHKRAARARAQAVELFDDVGPEGWVETVHSDEPDALELLCEAGEQARLVLALKNLPDRVRTMLSLYYQEELSYREIGEIYGVTESRVCQVIRGAQKQLRVLLDE